MRLHELTERGQGADGASELIKRKTDPTSPQNKNRKKEAMRQGDEERQTTTKRDKTRGRVTKRDEGAVKSDDERQRANEDKRRRPTASKKGVDQRGEER